MSQLQDKVRAQVWEGDALRMLDQRRLPQEEVWITCASAGEVAQAIKDMVVRGAPAIGIAAAYGVVLAARHCTADGFDKTAYEAQVEQLRASRPTAVNLFWALDRMQRLPLRSASDVPALEAEAKAIEAEDLAANRHMAELGAALIPGGSKVLTHCNTGSLATAGMGTALGVIRQGVAEGRVTKVYADETRPWLQGTRLTAWELRKDGIDVTLLADSAAALLMKQGGVDWVIVGADRITANGDVANKIGTYGLAVLARHHGLRFMVVAPSSTVDMNMASGDLIPIEERDPVEVWRPYEAVGAAWNPVFDVTPADLVDVIVTERGVVKSPDATAMRRMMEFA